MALETDDDATASTEISDKVLVTIEERIEATKVSDEDVGEDQEEGELSEKEEGSDEEKSVENTQVGTEASAEVPLLRRKVSLDDVSGRATMGLLGRDDYLKRGAVENLATDDEENPWLRDKVAFRPAATSYAPNLYNFAWAQAVQGNQGFKLVEREDGDDETEELPDNEADYEDDDDDEMEDGLPESLADMTLKIPEGYDMRQVLYDKRLMKNASWNATRGDGRREKNWMESEDGLRNRRMVEIDERRGTRVDGVGRREMRSPSRRRDGRVPPRRDRLEGDTERERRSEKDRGSEIDLHRARDRDRDRERARVKGRERGDRNETSLRPSSSDDSDQSRRSAPSGSNGRQSQSRENVAEVPEEGEIEEGEIELPAENSTRAASREKSSDPRADSPVEDGLPNGNLKRSLSSRLSFRNSSSDSRSLSRESSFRRLQDDDLRHRLTKDAEREKSREEAKLREDRREQIAHLTALMKSVTVKDAQK